MPYVTTAVPVRAVLGIALMVFLLGWTSTAVAQGVPECAPGTAVDVRFTSQEKGLDAPLVATHLVVIQSEIDGAVDKVSLALPAGVKTVGNTKGESIQFVVPIAASVAVTVSWRQATDQSDYDDFYTNPSAGCRASRVVTLAVLPAQPSRSVRQPGPRYGASFAVVPAQKRPDLSPLDISIRSTTQVRFPAARAKASKMTVPLNTADKVRYKTGIPPPTGLVALCRYWYLTCGTITTSVAALNIDVDALRRGIERPDLDGDNAILALLARSRPGKVAARFGVTVDAVPAGRGNRPFGFDLQVRQSGRLLARVRRAGRCREGSGPRGTFQCIVARASTKLG